MKHVKSNRVTNNIFEDSMQNTLSVMKPKIAWIYFTETRPDFYERRKATVEREINEVSSYLTGNFDCVQFGPIRSVRQALEVVRKVKSDNVCACILHLPIFVQPSMVALVARLLEKPIILLGNQKPDTSSFVGILGTGGILDQIGQFHIRICGSLENQINIKCITDYCWAANTVMNLRGQTFGAFGGISLGILTGTTDPLDWLRIFGILVVHFDQIEIINRAEAIADQDVEKTKTWLLNKVGYSEIGENVPTKAFDRQIRSYLATREIVKENNLDFVGIKCQSEMSDGYALQCINHMLLNDPYDENGDKDPIISSCETDMDGALTMKILNMITGGFPTATFDIRQYENSVLKLANCGATPSYYSTRSASAEENLKQVHLRKHVFGKAGGAATQFVAAPGAVTLARLQRHRSNYKMIVAEGEFIDMPREQLRETTWPWPHAFFRGNFDYERFLNTISANHIHSIPGLVASRLEYFCNILKIEYVRL